MEEYQVTVEGVTRPLPAPFFVIATQNPSDHIGTFPLPESQLDRFMMRVVMGYPDNKAERELLMGMDRRELLSGIKPVISPERLVEIQKLVYRIHVSSAILDYVQDLLDFSRDSGDFLNGLSPRAGLAVLRCARSWAMMEGHSEVLPEDVQAILQSVIGHRLSGVRDLQSSSTNLAAHLIRQVPIP
jgi:MoxR-like ATPases